MSDLNLTRFPRQIARFGTSRTAAINLYAPKRGAATKMTT